MSAYDVVLGWIYKITPYIVFGGICHFLVTAYFFFTRDQDGDKRTGFWGVIRVVFFVPMIILYYCDCIFYGLTVGLFDTLMKFEKNDPGLFKSRDKNKTELLREERNKNLKLEEEVRNLKRKIDEINIFYNECEDESTRIIVRKNETIAKLEKRIYELENELNYNEKG